MQIDSETSDYIPCILGYLRDLYLVQLSSLSMLPQCNILYANMALRTITYADAIQLYTIFYPCMPGDREQAVERLMACVKELRRWLTACWLKLNDDTSEMIMYMSKHHLNKQCTISDSTITPARHVRNLGVQVDQHQQGSNWTGWTDRQWEVIRKRRGTRVKSSSTSIGLYPRDWQSVIVVWSQWTGRNRCSQHGMKISRLFFTQGFVGQQIDLKQYSKPYWQPMKGTK